VNSRCGEFRLLLVADTHIGFDLPVRPRSHRRRRGPDFLDNFRKVLADAVEQRVDLVVHGGDLFFRSKVPDAIVDLAYGELLEFAGHGIPLVIVPGNHERSRLPSSLFLRHPNIHVFDSPRTFRFDLRGVRVALAGFPNIRRNTRTSFPRLLAETEWDRADADVRLLCVHQTIEGAQVGPSGYTFRNGHDVIRRRDLPAAFHAVLAGHIHRYQVLRGVRERTSLELSAGRTKARGAGAPLVIYPGSVERTSFAEADEAKGYCRLEFACSSDGAWSLSRNEFVTLATRPMVTVAVPQELAEVDVPGFLEGVAADAPPDAIIRFTCANGLSTPARRAFTSARLAECLPSTMNFQFGSRFFGSRSSEAPE
jgi:exonuclease SbcD